VRGAEASAALLIVAIAPKRPERASATVLVGLDLQVAVGRFFWLMVL
jgi:hypothetical protein